MANLNLSQFTEKTFVADADWTFVWDAAGAISKKVSRNNWLNSGVLTTSAPVTITQTWGALAQTFKALVVNAAGTSNANSASDSLLLDLQAGGVPQFSVNKLGNISFVGRFSTASIATQTANTFAAIKSNWGGGGGAWMFGGADINGSVSLGGDYIGFNALRVIDTTTSADIDTRIYRDGAANTLALRNGTNAQTFNVYGTYTASPLAYSRLAIACDTSGNATLTTQSTGTAGTISINGVPVGLRGQFSIAIGAGCLPVNTAIQNTGIGVNALQLNTSGNFNCGIGNNALASVTTGSNNIGLGSASGTSAGNASNSIFLGVDTKAAGTGQTNQIVIGYDATGLGSNTAVLGNASITTTALRGNVGIGTTAPSSKLHVNGAIIQKPDASATPPANGDLVVEATSNTTLTFKLKGTDGTVRSGTITLA